MADQTVLGTVIKLNVEHLSCDCCFHFGGWMWGNDTQKDAQFVLLASIDNSCFLCL